MSARPTEPVVPSAPPSGARLWALGARPRTLPASLAPVVVGTAATVGDGPLVWWRALAAGIVSLALQIGTNYANDYSDGVRGTDAVRVGPIRLVGSGLARPVAVKRAAIVAFAVAAVAGAALALATTPWLLAVGAAAIAAGWLYTGGPRPYGYLGLGELFVFVFFGLVATAGSTFVQHQQVTLRSLLAGTTMGCLSCSLLVVNNLRDIPTDTESGKRTLAVRLGDARTRWFYLALVVVGFASAAASALAHRPWALLALLAVPAAVAPARTVLGGARGPGLIPVLGGTGRLTLAVGLGLAAGFALG